MTIRLFPSPPRLAGDAEPLDHRHRARYREAAHHAGRRYPGAVGELLRRELTAYAEFGYRLGVDTLISRIAAAVLEPSEPDVAAVGLRGEMTAHPPA